MMPRGDGRHRAEDVLAPRMEVGFDGAALQQQFGVVFDKLRQFFWHMVARSVIPQRFSSGATLDGSGNNPNRSLANSIYAAFNSIITASRSSSCAASPVVPVAERRRVDRAHEGVNRRLGFAQLLPASDVGVICHTDYLDSWRTMGLMRSTSP